MDYTQKFSAKIFFYAFITIIAVIVGVVAFYLLKPQGDYFAIDPFVTEDKKDALDSTQLVLHDEAKESMLFDVPNCTATPDTKAGEVFLSQLNTYRQQQGLPQVKLSHQLMNAATWMAKDLVQNPKKSHIDTLERNADKRIRDCGYKNGKIYELVAGGKGKTPLAIWVDSPKNNEILLRPDIIVIGYAQATSGDKNRWVATIGTFDDLGGIPPMPSVPPMPSFPASPTPTKEMIELPGPPTSTPTPTQSPDVTTTPIETPTPTPNP